MNSIERKPWHTNLVGTLKKKNVDLYRKPKAGRPPVNPVSTSQVIKLLEPKVVEAKKQVYDVKKINLITNTKMGTKIKKNRNERGIFNTEPWTKAGGSLK